MSSATAFLIYFVVGMLACKADTYEFELSKEVAHVNSNKLNVNTLKKAADEHQKPTQVLKENKPVWKEPEKSYLTVKTGPDALWINGRDLNRIYDFKNMRIYDLNSSASTYMERSLYADLATRQSDLRNRLALHDAIGRTIKGKHANHILDDFFNEERYALTLPDRHSGYVLTKEKLGDADVYNFGKLIVTSVIPGSQSVSGDKLRQFSRFLIYATHLHPDIREDIEKMERLPDRFMCLLENHPISKERCTFTLKKVTPGDFAGQVPAGYTQARDPHSPLFSVYPCIKDRGGEPPADLRQQTIEYYKKAVEKKNYLDALLAVSEYGLQTGENLTNEMSAIKDQIKEDAECKKLIAGLRTPRTEQEAMLALGSLDSINRTHSSKSYLIDIFRANLIVAMNERGLANLATKQDADPSATFVKVLKINPFLAGVYHDLGEYLDQTDKHTYAWECYELAHKFYPKHPFMKDVMEREHELSESFPQFFYGDKL